jgi:hypothetical protein
MKLKDSVSITDSLFNKTILDMCDYSDNDFQPSELLFFVKDTRYDGDVNNKLSLIIVNKCNGYVVNNDFKFNSLEINDNEIIIYRMEGKNRTKSYYWIKSE